MITEPIAVPITLFSKPCFKTGVLVEVVKSEGLYYGTVKTTNVEGDTVYISAEIFFNCQHWIYNRNLPDDVASETGFSSFCLGDEVLVFISPTKSVIIGLHNSDVTGVLRQPCWPIFDTEKAFAVGVVSASDTLNTWGNPFIKDPSNPQPYEPSVIRSYDFVEPYIDIFNEERPLGTYMPAVLAAGQQVRLITQHTIEGDPNTYFVAHTIHEILRDVYPDIHFCPSTTENSRYFLNRKITYNKNAYRLVVDDISIVKGIVDSGSLMTISLLNDFSDPVDHKIFLFTCTKLLDRITTIYDTNPNQIELSVGYTEIARVDHLFCLKKLIEAGGEQQINDLPLYSSGQLETVFVDRAVMCVANSGAVPVVNVAGMRIILYAWGDEGLPELTHNYEILVTYDPDAPNLMNAQVTQLGHYDWAPNVTGLGVTGYVSPFGQAMYYTIYYYFDSSMIPCEVSCSAGTFNGPDYPSYIGGDHEFTAGIYGEMDDFVFKDIPTRTEFYHPYYKTTQSFVSKETRTISLSGDTCVIYKHDGIEISRGISIFNFQWHQVINFAFDASEEPYVIDWGRRITGDSLDFVSSYTFSEVHWLVIRPDLEFYVFVEVLVYQDYEVYKTWPDKPVEAKLYTWYRGEKTLLSSKSCSFAETPTLNEWSLWYGTLDAPTRFNLAESKAPTPYIKIGPQWSANSSDYVVGFDLPKWIPSWDPGSVGGKIRLPRVYWYQAQVYDKNLTYDGSNISNSSLQNRYRNAMYSEFQNYFFSPDLNEVGSWAAVLPLYNTSQIYKGYTNHWSWMSASNEINQTSHGISSDYYSAARPFTPATISYAYGVNLGSPQFFGGHLYISIPDPFTTGLVHEFFSGPADMLAKIKAAVNPDDPDNVILTSTIN